MPEGKPTPLDFPSKGIDVTREFQLQPPGTTPDALNVRSRDSIAQRNRGGSRPGYSPYIPQLIPAGVKLIQHLNFIVDPTTAALPQNFITPDDTWIVDPRTGNTVPPGGAPWQPNPNVEPQSGFRLIEAIVAEGTIADQPLRKLSLTLTGVPLAGDLIVVNVYTQQFDADGSDGDLGVTDDVENNAAANLTQAGSYVATNNATGANDSYWRLSMWYKIAVGVADKVIHVHPSPDTVPDEPTDGIYMQVSVMQFRGSAIISPLIDDVSNIDAGPTTTIATGNLTTEDGCLVVVAMDRRGTASPSPAMTLRTSTLVGIDAFCAFTKLPVAVPPGNPFNVTFTFASVDNVGVLAASFKKLP